MKAVLCADVRLGSTVETCWTAELSSAFEGLARKTAFQHAVGNMQPVDLNDFVPDLRAWHLNVWRGVARLDPCETNDKLASYERWMALPHRPCSMAPGLLPVPKYLQLNLPRHVQRNVSCFRLRAHRLAVETATWSVAACSTCNCGCPERQDEKHVLLACRFPQVCTLRENYPDLFGGFSSLSPGTGTSFMASLRAVPDYFIFQFMNQCKKRKDYAGIDDTPSIIKGGGTLPPTTKKH
ncbi:MAG: hypothetical protein ACNS64_16240 [Candidatus Halalkalibacterium sp. M3_1C_030]